ncbi:hypothetical protein ABZV64_04030 [Streptomyces sp. NPDC004959]|uniref:hypothetical protein n=1 Tax=unclassified Streptomyces TaxID=2593676 RepID=UPI0004C989CE|nr:hypothetical protein [Streptomyces sp. NRRL F-5630]
METSDRELRKELDATLQARRELGEEYDSALIDSFLEKVEHRVDETIDRRVRRGLAEQQVVVARGAAPRGPRGHGSTWLHQYSFALISLVLAIPLSAIASTQAGTTGLIVAWAGIVGVNVAARGFSPSAPAGSARSRD